MKRKNNSEGFTLIEVLVASFILLVGILGTASLIINSIKYNEANQKRVVAQKLLQGEVSKLRGIDISDFTQSKLKNKLGFSSSVKQGYPSGGDVNSNCPSDYEFRLYKAIKKNVNDSSKFYKYTLKLCVDDDYLTPYLKRVIVTIYWTYNKKLHSIKTKLFITPGVR